VRLRKKFRASERGSLGASVSNLFAMRGVPGPIRCDNGSEFTADALRRRLKHVGVATLSIEPLPLGERLCRSFHCRIRDDCSLDTRPWAATPRALCSSLGKCKAPGGTMLVKRKTGDGPSSRAMLTPRGKASRRWKVREQIVPARCRRSGSCLSGCLRSSRIANYRWRWRKPLR
jgi:hypothetical protein